MKFLGIWKKEKILEDIPDNSVVINLEKEIVALKVDKKVLEEKVIASESKIEKITTVVSQYEAVFPVLRDLNSIAENKTEKSVINATDDIFTISKKSSDLGMKISKILSNTFLGEKGLSQSTETLMQVNFNIHQLNTDFKALSADFDTRLTEFDEQFRKIKVHLSEIVSISEETNVLSINMAIEAARMGREAGAFTVLSKAIKNISDKSRKIAMGTEDMVIELDRLLGNSITRSEEKTSHFAKILNTINLEVDAVSRQIQKETIQAEKSIKETKELPEIIRKELHDIITILQFQDITHQVQEHIIQILEEMNKMNNDMLFESGFERNVDKDGLSPEIFEMIKTKFTVAEEWTTIGAVMSGNEEKENITLF